VVVHPFRVEPISVPTTVFQIGRDDMENQALGDLLSLLESVDKAPWIADEHSKALWFDVILEKYKVFVQATKKQ